MELAVMLKINFSLEDIIKGRVLFRIFHAMHDGGKFNEANIDELIGMIFNHFS